MKNAQEPDDSIKHPAHYWIGSAFSSLKIAQKTMLKSQVQDLFNDAQTQKQIADEVQELLARLDNLYTKICPFGKETTHATR